MDLQNVLVAVAQAFINQQQQEEDMKKVKNCGEKQRQNVQLIYNCLVSIKTLNV